MLKLSALFLLLLVLLNPFTLAWIATRYVVDDGLQPADAIVVLRGDPPEERVRTDEAAKLLAEHYAPLILLDVSARPFFNVPEAQLVTQYLKQKGVATEQMRFCENSADSTDEEALALRHCLQRIGARQVIVVTSEYHTRRARSILRHEFAGSGIVARVHPVYVPEYWDPHWWRKRRWAKTFFMETVKSLWTEIELLLSRFQGKVSAFSDQLSAFERGERAFPRRLIADG